MRMANGILKNLNRSLELTLSDNLDGLKEFTLMMAAASVRPQHEILPAEHVTPTNPECSSAPLRLIDTQPENDFIDDRQQEKKRA